MRILPFLLVIALPSIARAAPGDVLVTESFSGSVVVLREGDLSDDQRLATGLTDPTGICRGPNGHIYVVETTPGEITIIDEGGDMSGVQPFAYGLPGVVGLWCDDEHIYTGIFVSGVGVVLDVTVGGDIPMIPTNQLRFASSPSLTTAVVVDDAGSMFVVGGDVWDVTGGGPHTEDPAHAFGVGLVSATVHDGMLLGGQYQGARVYDFTRGGDLSLAEPWATLPDHGLDGVEALVDAGDAGLFALVGNAVYALGDGGDLSLAEPFAHGLRSGLAGEDPLAGVEGMLHHVCSTDDDCNDADACNGAEQCIDNACVATEPLDCDDGDLCTADACDPAEGCQHAPIPECCNDDFDCEIDEVCDPQTDQCVPIDPTGGEASGSDGSSGGSETTDGPPPGGGTTGSTTHADADTDADTDDAAAVSGDGGCGCSSRDTGSGPLLVGLLALGRLRRRSRYPSVAARMKNGGK